ncbi:glutamate-cysteine ligase family protein [Kineosporia succinea]|uniref:Glutamate--cysteine ligase EgtA n=1 Tax=Kineosporia succinea TaxID=84632 RepID=A0ABT9P2P3_9ACTN|nr:glutamate-cysteine ligase family protein [Kineosporia succinea]MDP9826959.1 glutamate--cysteine ligase [Kineosporia succinea]
MSIEDLAQAAGPAAGPVSELPNEQPITEADAEGWIPRTCFKCGPPRRVGIELEFLIHRDVDPPEHLAPDKLAMLHADIQTQPLRSRFTVEPGGQVELSSLPADRLSGAIADLTGDLAVLTAVAARHGARLVGTGIDALPSPVRYLQEPRYAAMEEYFDRTGSAGRTMMRSSASVQVNVESGLTPGDFQRRWDLLHAIGPATAAAFGRPSAHRAIDPRLSGYRLLRQGIWRELDPERCLAPVPTSGETLQEAYTRWVLDAPVLAVRRNDRPWTAPAGLTFRRWLREGDRAMSDTAAPTLEDLKFHLTTLFPPVRARGFYEVRYLDQQPGPWWRVAAASVAALAQDDTAADQAMEVCEPVRDAWDSSARAGLTDPALKKAARAVLEIAAAALDRDGDTDLAARTAEYLDRVALETDVAPNPDAAAETPC